MATSELDASVVRDVLLEQHERLRSLLATLDARAVGVIRGEAPREPSLGVALEEVATALDDHMPGEERALAMFGPVSTAELERLHGAHEGQREEIASMRRLAASSDDAIALALAVRAFVDDVLLDMSFEERNYLRDGEHS